MLTLLFYLLSAVVVAYHTYKYTWFHIIKLFETVNNASNPIPSLLHTASSANILQLIASDDDVTTKKHIETVKHLARYSFTTTVTCTVLIIEFILVQLNRDFSSDSPEHTLWNTLLFSIVICLVFVQPGAMCFLLVNKLFKSDVLNNDSTKLVMSMSLLIGWLVFVSRSYVLTDLSVVDGAGFMSYYVQRVSIMGVTLMAVLNGVGSFSTVYYYLYKRLSPQRKLSVEESLNKVQMLEKTLQNTENMISTKEMEYKQRMENDSDGSINKRTNIQPKGSFMDLQSLPFFNKEPSEQSTLNTEIHSLKMIKNDIYVKLLRAQQALDQSSATGTPAYKERITTLISRVVSFYCVFKIIQVTIVQLLQYFDANGINTSQSDPLVLTLSHIAEIFYPFEDEEVLVNQFSFVISGILFVCSFNGVFMTLTHLYRFLPIDLSKLDSSSPGSTKKNQKSVSVIKNLVVSELMGIYVLATITILKSNLTQSVESKLSELMLTTGLEMTIVDRWFDKVFLVSVVCTGIVIRIGEIWLSDGLEEQDLMGKIV